MDLGNGYGHLTYSTLVHPGDTWPEMRASLETYLPEVKRRFSPDAPMGVSLRISNASAELLINDPAERAWVRKFLGDNDLYVYTVNAFPFGPFKGQRVKEQVYEPDWTTEDRTRYTMNVATILTEITGPDVEPTIQSAPLEPEPYCFLETIEETVGYFNAHVYTLEAAIRVAELSGQPLAEVFGGLRRHLGIVFDICHQSVGFEDITEDLHLLMRAGIPIFKLQEAAALLIPDATPEIVEELKRYTGTIYLSQTTELRAGVLTRFLNLEDAIAAWESDPGPREWRTHFHVPVFLKDLGPFQTTRAGIDAAARGARANAAIHASGDRDVHLGRPARTPQDWGHHRVCRARVGVRP